MTTIIKAGTAGGNFSGLHADLTDVSADQHHAQSHTLTSHSTRAHSELTGVGATDHHSNANDHASTNDPTANQKAALAGTGTPSGTDKYVNDSDARNTNSRAPNGAASGELGGSYPSPTVNATHSGSAHLALATNAIVLGTAAAAGAAGTTLRSNDTIAAFDATAPVTQASADVAATGSVAFAARRDHKHGMPTIPAAASGGTPALTLGTANTPGAAATFIRTDDTMLAFDATVPTTSATADVAAAGVATVTARRDHLHARESLAQSVYEPAKDETLVAGATTIIQTDPLILDSGRLLTIPATSLLWTDAITPATQFPYTSYDPVYDESILANATTIFDSDPLVIDAGRLITIPPYSLLWMDAARFPDQVSSPTGAASLYNSTYNFERTVGQTTTEAAMFVKSTRASGGSASDAIAGIIGSVDVTASQQVNHVAGVVGYIAPTISPTKSVTWIGVEAHDHATVVGTYVGVLGNTSLENATSNSGTTAIGVDALVDISAGGGVATGATAVGIRSKITGTGWTNAVNAILGDGSLTGQNFATSFRGYSSLTGQTGEATYDVTVKDGGAGVGAYVLHDVSMAKFNGVGGGIKFQLPDAGGNTNFNVVDSGGLTIFNVTTAGSWSGAKVVDFTEVTAPGNPASLTRRMYVDSTDHKTKVKSSAGTVINLEEQDGTVMYTPIGSDLAGLATNTALATNTSYFVYIGRIQQVLTTLKIRCNVTVAVATITWAEVGVFKGTPAIAGNASLTRLGFVDVSATFNTTGLKTTSVTIANNPGDDLWLAFGSQATTPYQVRGALADETQTGLFQTFAGRISTMALPTTTALAGAAIVPPYAFGSTV